MNYERTASGLKYKSNINEVKDTTSEHIYYNVQIINDENAYLPLDFEQKLNDPILENPANYEGSIIRFLMSGQALPVFNFQTRDTDYLGNEIVLASGDYGLGIYCFNIVYNNAGAVENYVGVLKFKPSDYYAGTYDFYVNNYNTMIAMMNLALYECYTEFKTAFPATTAVQPYFTFNSLTGALTLQNLTGWDDTTVYPSLPANGKAQLWCNSQLARFLSGLPTFSALNSYISQYSYFNGVDTYLLSYVVDRQIQTQYATIGQTDGVPTATATPQLLSEINCFSQWNDARSLIFTSKFLGNVPESIPQSTTSLTSNTDISVINVSGNNNTKQIITDFIVSSDNGTDTFSNLVYNPTAEYRIFNFTKKDPIRIVDFQVLWLDIFGNYNTYYVPPYQSVSLKLMFRKKK